MNKDIGCCLGGILAVVILLVVLVIWNPGNEFPLTGPKPVVQCGTVARVVPEDAGYWQGGEMAHLWYTNGNEFWTEEAGAMQPGEQVCITTDGSGNFVKFREVQP